MDRPEFGKGIYRYFGGPIPKVVDELRRAVYPSIAQIANEWQQMLGDSDRFPEEWGSFRDRCHDAGQKTPTPILLKYGCGGFNALHRDLRGAVFFPIQMAVVLSPRADLDDVDAKGFKGGEFLFCDSPERRKSLRREVVLGLGDAVLFCTRDRLVQTGGVVGLQPVKHSGMPPSRPALGSCSACRSMSIGEIGSVSVVIPCSLTADTHLFVSLLLPLGACCLSMRVRQSSSV